MVALRLVTRQLQVEEVLDGGVLVRIRTSRDAPGRQRDRMHAEAFQRRLGVAQILPRRPQLFIEDLPQLGQFLALELRRHLDVALRHGIRDRGNAGRIGTTQAEV